MADRKLNARKTALIIQDLQNDVITRAARSLLPARLPMRRNRM